MATRIGVDVGGTFADCVASTAATFKVVESLSTGARVPIPAIVS